MRLFGNKISLFKSKNIKNLTQTNIFNEHHKEGDVFSKNGNQYEVKRGVSGKTRVHRADEQLNIFEHKKEKPKLTLETKTNKQAEHLDMLKPKGKEIEPKKQAVEEPEDIYSKTTEMYGKKQGRKYSKEEAEKILNEYMKEVAEMQDRGEINSKKKRSKIYQKRVELGLHEVPIPVSKTEEGKNEKYSIEITSEYNLGDPHVYDNYWNLDDAIKDLHKVHEYMEDKEKEKHTAYIVKYIRNEGNEDGDEFLRDNDWDEDKYVKTYGGINEKTKEILREVQDEFGGKYSEINLGNNKEGEAVTLELRISDHSGNDKNTNYNSVNTVLSIVIANKDYTERFKKSEYSIPNEYYFDENYSATKIINFINKKIKELKHSIV